MGGARTFQHQNSQVHGPRVVTDDANLVPDLLIHLLSEAQILVAKSRRQADHPSFRVFAVLQGQKPTGGKRLADTLPGIVCVSRTAETVYGGDLR